MLSTNREAILSPLDGGEKHRFPRWSLSIHMWYNHTGSLHFTYNIIRFTLGRWWIKQNMYKRKCSCRLWILDYFVSTDSLFVISVPPLYLFPGRAGSSVPWEVFFYSQFRSNFSEFSVKFTSSKVYKNLPLSKCIKNDVDRKHVSCWLLYPLTTGMEGGLRFVSSFSSGK